MKILIEKENDLNVGIVNAFILCIPVYTLIALVVYFLMYA